ncbi:MAG: 4-(cytidine 5'-diphospho)-2-C-methyl-D-erythritol kinase [Pseudomonadota bacterium]|nr:4-(cytidine 5'-diphospho)-2-C-methyl-D-erythritol kinase [Pseudomonadota bacterium]
MAAAEASAVGVAALAKLNLYLHVTGRRDDGYHTLDSLIVFAGIGDRVIASPADDLGLQLTGPFAQVLAGDPDNLVLHAAHLLARAGGVEPRAAISLEKNLPVAAGLGGGSADAAAALRALATLWNLSIAADDLAALALDLGADVPVCLAARAAFVGGIGEDLAPPPPLPSAHMVLVNPGVALPTAAVFGELGGVFTGPGRFAEAPTDAASLARALAARSNDLEAPARRLCPEVDQALAALTAEPGCLLARMSGSGATCFGLFANAGHAAAAADRISAGHSEWWVELAPLLYDPVANG